MTEEDWKEMIEKVETWLNGDYTIGGMRMQGLPPRDSDDIEFGKIAQVFFINGNKMFLNNSIFNHNPKVGDVILFPNYLMHTAYPFTSKGERRSFSFNAEIDNNIANVFKNE